MCYKKNGFHNIATRELLTGSRILGYLITHLRENSDSLQKLIEEVVRKSVQGKSVRHRFGNDQITW